MGERTLHGVPRAFCKVEETSSLPERSGGVTRLRKLIKLQVTRGYTGIKWGSRPFRAFTLYRQPLGASFEGCRLCWDEWSSCLWVTHTPLSNPGQLIGAPTGPWWGHFWSSKSMPFLEWADLLFTSPQEATPSALLPPHPHLYSVWTSTACSLRISLSNDPKSVTHGIFNYRH